MVCEQCGGGLTEDARFCAHCGTPVPQRAPATASEPTPSVSWAGPPPHVLPPPPKVLPPPPPVAPPPPPGWPNHGAYAYAPPTKTNGFAVAAMVLGIVWIYWIGSILALVFGYIAKGQIARSEGTQTGRGMAIAGIVLGWVGVAFLAFVVGLAIAEAT
jgi:hypothetical protein